MITRLKIDGFKNFVQTDIRFGPFTCIAGGNGVGKSNLFDAIQFLSLLSELPFDEAATKLRQLDNSSNFGQSVKSIFRRTGDTVASKMSIEVEMLIPRTGEDELGQPAEATFNFLRYSLELGLNTEENGRGSIQLLREKLEPIRKGDAAKHLLFDHTYKWRNALIKGRRTVPFISTTKNEAGELLVNFHQDGGSGGKPQPFPARNLPRTILSTARYASEHPTAILVRREMQSWRRLQLEPSALRNPSELDQFSYRTATLGNDGSNIAAAIYRLTQQPDGYYRNEAEVFATLTNELRDLLDDVRGISIDRDEKRRLLTLQVTTKEKTVLPARSLSDGTLRFLALAVLALDQNEPGVICMEEPENGIHPERIPAILELLQRIPTSTDSDDLEEGSLRQVIINTHSPAVVMEVPEDVLLYVDLTERIIDGKRTKVSVVKSLPATWRADEGMPTLSKGKLLSYLNPEFIGTRWIESMERQQRRKKVKERTDLKALKNTLFSE